MKNAYEVKEYYNRDGRCLRRERAIGPIVIWALVALAAIIAGQSLNVPASLVHLFK
ncbi:MAG TPA: hypothetical protein VKF63_12655 [Terracidiphilus sp.]|nr:hypothetical protein [Terracidiphilus sp.]